MKYIIIMLLFISSIYAKEDNKVDNNINIFVEPTFDLYLRSRYEIIDEDDKYNSSLLTNKTKISFHSFIDFDSSLSVKLEGTFVNNLGINKTENKDCPECSINEDKSNNRLTEYYINYNLLENTFIRIGRQTINIGNERFVSSNNWYQMEQTFDAISIANNQLNNFVFILSYIYYYNGKELEEEKQTRKDIISNIKYNNPSLNNIDLYSYILSEKHNTYGINFYNNKNILNYNIDFAYQKSNTDIEFNSLYFNFELSYKFSKLETTIGYEFLGKNQKEDNSNGFTIPYGNTTKFNGKLDIFNNIVKEGHNGDFIDKKILNKYKTKNYGDINFDIHQFSLDGKSIGIEYDLFYQQKLKYVSNLNIYLGTSIYNGENNYNNESKIWLQFDLKI